MGRNLWAFFWGVLVAVLGGLIGVGGAEFRLPILVSFFNFRTLQAVMINLIISLVTVTFSLLFRSGVLGLEGVVAHWFVVINILAGSLFGSYLGVNYATRIHEQLLHRVVVVFLIFLSFVLLGHHWVFSFGSFQWPLPLQVMAGLIAGVVIGIFSSMLGVAGGELIIPTIILIFAVDIKLAGSLSLVISMPTILMGLFKFSKNHRLKEIKSERTLMIFMGVGSIVGALIGSNLLRYVSSTMLYYILGGILLLSAFKLAHHRPVS